MANDSNAEEECHARASAYLPLVYDELRRLAAAKIADERIDHTLGATALVHEAYLRLGGGQTFTEKSEFLKAAASAMRRVLIDHARAKGAEKRGGGRRRVEISDLAASSADEHLLELDEALDELMAFDPQAAEIVELRHFAGLTIPEIAETLGVSPRSADRGWSYAKAWLYRRISENV